VSIRITVFWDVTTLIWYIDTDVSDETAASAYCLEGEDRILSYMVLES
jgi:hypothetical protein